MARELICASTGGACLSVYFFSVNLAQYGAPGPPLNWIQRHLNPPEGFLKSREAKNKNPLPFLVLMF